MEAMEVLLKSAKMETLVEMVKQAQKRKMRGSKGQWKEFLIAHDKYGTSMSDPSRRTSDDLIEFLKTFTQDEDVKFFEKLLQFHANREKVASIAPDNESSEQRLVRQTSEHPQYPVDFFFPSYEEGWVVVKASKKSGAKNSKKIVAIDCEMVLCEDGTEAVVKVCVVDHDLKVLIDEVINPNKEIADYRTNITGISAKDLAGVTRSLKDVQSSVKSLLSHGTILVGHGLHNDLKALKMDHARVIDTSYIFKYANGTSVKKPSLTLLCKALLNFELRKKGEPHNCFDDACAAMKLVLASLEGKIDATIPKEHQDLEMEKLVIHRIPLDITSEDLKSIIPGEFSLEVKDGKKSRKMYTATACFKSRQEAMDAFRKVEGSIEKDSCGRPQKVVNFQLKSGVFGTLCVCKMFNQDTDISLTKKRAGEPETNSISKKPRAGEALEQHECSSECETHLKETASLKDQLSKREEEIMNMSKIILALTRKQGL